MTQGSRENLRRRGSIYVAALGVSTIIATLSVGGIVASRIQLRSANDGNDVADARCAAASGLEFARQWTATNAGWRSSGIPTITLSVSGCSLTLAAVDPTDGNLANLPLDPVLITATARKGTSVCQMLSQMAVAVGTPYSCLAYGVHTAGQLHVLAKQRLISNQTVSAGTEYRGDGTLEGSVLANKLTVSGLVYGSSTLSTTARTVPVAATTASAFQALASTVTLPASNTISNVVFGPGCNPYGSVNANGLYYLNTGGKPVTISNCRIYGTLVIVNSKPVTISGNVFFAPYRADFPSLIITGDANFTYDSTSNLSELSQLTNFNPATAPYKGVSNSTLSDSYPSEIDGLVEVGGQLTLGGTGTVRGAIVDESTSNDAVKISSVFQVIYDPKIFMAPPNFYTSAVQMAAQAGTTTQIVN